MLRFLSILTFLLLTTIHTTAQWGPRIISPEVADDNTVTFRILAKEADEVLLTGNWMSSPQGMPGSEAMVKGDTGLWTLTVGPLEPELYSYNFIVEGVTTLDPANYHIKRDGTWRVENVLYVPGEGSDLYWAKAGPKGTVHQVWYESPTLDMTRRMYVYTPPGYENGDEEYPVMYLLHGGGGDEAAWPDLGVAPTIMDNLINAGTAVPMLVVMTNGNPDQAAAYTVSPKLDREPLGGRAMANGLFEESLVHDVIPYIESHYRVTPAKEARALTGLSMGGLQTMSTTFKYPDLFDYIGVMSMGMPDLSRFGIEVSQEDRTGQIQALKAGGSGVVLDSVWGG